MSPADSDAKPRDPRWADDGELARSAAAGDEDALRAVALRLLDRARTTVRYLCGDSPDHPDLVQECLMQVLRSIGSYRGESLLETWGDRVVVRTALRLIKRERARLEDADDAVIEHAVEPDTPESALRRARRQAGMAALYQKLSPERRAVVMLRAVYGYSTPEIAAITESGLETVRSRYKMARRQLRRLVATEPALREWAHGEGEES
jgi:RNA polymerase sigma-70 factor (ECF subfamily)